jgi:hypothetical protein
MGFVVSYRLSAAGESAGGAAAARQTRQSLRVSTRMIVRVNVDNHPRTSGLHLPGAPIAAAAVPPTHQPVIRQRYIRRAHIRKPPIPSTTVTTLHHLMHAGHSTSAKPHRRLGLTASAIRLPHRGVIRQFVALLAAESLVPVLAFVEGRYQRINKSPGGVRPD